MVYMGKAEDNFIQAEKFIEAMNQHDADMLGSVCADNVVSIEMTEPRTPVEGRDAVVEAYRELFEGFPDSNCRSMFKMANEKGVLIEVVWTGTNEKPFRGNPATGKPVKLLKAYVFIFENDKIFHIHDYFDGASYLAQMGMSL